MRRPLAISGWSVISPFGLTAGDFTEAVRAGRSTDSELVPGFEVREVLGKKGTRSMDRVTGLAVLTVGRLLERDAPADRETAALVLGTTTGSVQSMMSFTRDSLLGDKPYHVDPAVFPNTVMNCAAGQCAIWHGLRGPNTTIAAGSVTGLSALSYAARLYRCGHAETVLVGAVEEWSEQRALLSQRSAMTGPPVEGCAVFMLEDMQTARESGRSVQAELLGTDFGVFCDAAPAADVLTRCVRGCLDRAGLGPGDVWAVSVGGRSGDLIEAERNGLAAALGDARPHRIAVADLLGDTGAATASLQVAAVLALAGADERARGAAALVTSIDPDGLVGCALIRFP